MLVSKEWEGFLLRNNFEGYLLVLLYFTTWISSSCFVLKGSIYGDTLFDEHKIHWTFKCIN